jgi:hypothetical protein
MRRRSRGDASGRRDVTRIEIPVFGLPYSYNVAIGRTRPANAVKHFLWPISPEIGGGPRAPAVWRPRPRCRRCVSRLENASQRIRPALHESAPDLIWSWRRQRKSYNVITERLGRVR